MEEKNAKKKTNVFITVLIIIAIVALVFVKHSMDNLTNVISNYQENNNNNNNEQNYYDDDTNWEDRIDELEQTIKKQSQSIDTLKTCEDNYEPKEDISDGKATLEIKNLDLTVDESEVSGYTPQICFSKDGKVVYSQNMKYNAENNQYYGSAKTTVDCNNNDTYKCFFRYIGKSGL